MNREIDAVLRKLSLVEKVKLLAGADAWTTNPIDRVGIPSIKMTDGPNGARGNDVMEGNTSACFPVGIAMGATWNLDLIRRVGASIAREAKSKSGHVLLGPTVNIQRSPLLDAFSSASPKIHFSAVLWRLHTSKECRAKESPPASSTSSRTIRSTNGNRSARSSMNERCTKSISNRFGSLAKDRNLVCHECL